MSWVLTREDDSDFEMRFDTKEELVEYTHSVPSLKEIAWFSIAE